MCSSKEVLKLDMYICNECDDLLNYTYINSNCVKSHLYANTFYMFLFVLYNIAKLSLP